MSLTTSQIAKRGCLGGCLGLVALVLLAAGIGLVHDAMMTPAERAAEETKRRVAAEKAAAEERAATKKTRQEQMEASNTLLRKLTLLRRQLPSVETLKEMPYPAAFKDEQVTYESADSAFLAQFAETGFVPMQNPDAHLWYRGQDLEAIQTALTAAKTPAERDTAALARAAKSLDEQPYLAVIYPLEQSWPVMEPDGKHYQAGYFRGWILMLDFKKLTPICQTKFEAGSSSKVTNRRLKVVGVPIGQDLESAVDGDFTNNFWAAANKALGLMRQPNDGGGGAAEEDATPR